MTTERGLAFGEREKGLSEARDLGWLDAICVGTGA